MKIKNITIFCLTYILFSLVDIEARSQEITSGQLFQNLGELKKNVDQLSIDNQTLVLKNQKTKASINELQIAYQKIVQEGIKLQEAQEKIQKANAPKQEQIDQLIKTLSDLRNQESALDEQIKKSQEANKLLMEEDIRLNIQPNPLKESQNATSDLVNPAISDMVQQKQKQKLALLKLIAESEDHQVLLHEKFLDFKKTSPVDGVGLEANKADLENRYVQLQEQIVHLNAILNNTKPAWGEEQIHQLELSVNNLQKNQDELKVLLQKIQQKASLVIKPEDKSEDQLKMEANIQQFKKEAKSLRIDLEELQQQMIDLDKRKAYLEAILQ